MNFLSVAGAGEAKVVIQHSPNPVAEDLLDLVPVLQAVLGYPIQGDISFGRGQGQPGWFALDRLLLSRLGVAHLGRLYPPPRPQQGNGDRAPTLARIAELAMDDDRHPWCSVRRAGTHIFTTESIIWLGKLLHLVLPQAPKNLKGIDMVHLVLRFSRQHGIDGLNIQSRHLFLEGLGADPRLAIEFWRAGGGLVNAKRLIKNNPPRA